MQKKNIPCLVLMVYGTHVTLYSCDIPYDSQSLLLNLSSLATSYISIFCADNCADDRHLSVEDKILET